MKGKPFEAYQGDAPYIFVSYSHRDAAAVDVELQRLHDLGFNVWYDEGISPGSRWTDELAERISNCSLFLFFVTPNSVASQNCQDEANFVLEAGRPFLAVHLLRTVLPPGLNLRMGSRQAILKNMLAPDQYERKLEAAIRKHVLGLKTPAMGLAQGFRLGDFAVEPLAGTIAGKNGDARHVEPKVIDVLIALAGQAGKIVTREQLLETVWPGQVAADELLTRAISELRSAFDDDRADPRYIVTVPKRGYRLIAAIEVPAGSAAEDRPDISTTVIFGMDRKRAVLAAGVVTLVIAYFAIDRIVIYPSRSVGSDLTGVNSDTGQAESLLSLAGRPRPLTSMDGYEFYPSLSPDGSYVAFVLQDAEDPGRGDIYVMEVGGGTPVRRTDTEQYERAPIWSPDGTRIAFARGTADGKMDIIVKPMLGGFETRLTTVDEWRGHDWSTDGDRIAIAIADGQIGPASVFMLSLGNGDLTKFTNPPGTSGDFSPRFSPDGQSLAFIRWGLDGPGADICLQALDNTDVRCITPEEVEWNIDDIAWTADSEALVAKTFGLIRVPVSGGAPTALPYGENTVAISVARFGNRLVFENEFQEVNLWRIPGPTALESGEPQRLISSTLSEFFPDYSPDGSKIAFVSSRTGTWEAWAADADGSNPRRLTDWGFANYPRWSPDGLQIIFDSGRHAVGSGEQEYSTLGHQQSEVFSIDASGGVPRMIIPGGKGARAASWSADGQTIYFNRGFDDCGEQIWKRDLDTGDEVMLARCSWRPLEGADGRIFFWDEESKNIVSMLGDGTREEIEFGPQCRRFTEAWTPWNRSLIYVDCQDLTIKMLDLDTRETRVFPSGLTHGEITQQLSLDVSPDGKWIVFSRVDRAGSDLMLVEPFQ